MTSPVFDPRIEQRPHKMLRQAPVLLAQDERPARVTVRGVCEHMFDMRAFEAPRCFQACGAWRRPLSCLVWDVLEAGP